MSAHSRTIEFGPAPPDRRAVALALLFSQESTDEKAAKLAAIFESTRNQADAFSSLITATEGLRIVGSVWGQRLPGQTACIWPARVIDDGGQELADRLQQKLDQSLAAAGVKIAQMLSANVEHDDSQRLIRCGYKHVADLLYLVCLLGQKQIEPATDELEFETYDESQRARLGALVERTYTDTLDIPALDGQRKMDDVLEGYRQTGEFASERWLFVRSDGEDVGCLLLADHPIAQQWELVYMGLVPEARGNGWGRLVASHAQTLANAAGRERLVLAVDADNAPAITAYARAGFVEWFRRAVLLKSFANR